MGSLYAKVEAAIAAVQASERDTSAIFLEFSPERILADAEQVEERHANGETLPLYGSLISLKDLIDERGQQTTAGSLLFAAREPAESDAEIVKRLEAAGAVMFGRTSLSEFAYSGVGLNPHFGSPGSVFDETRVPGGSSSGAALSVALDFCDAAIGTDTGGSVRVPAAINGLVGIKPTQANVPRMGVHVLSDTFDSVGPLARDLETALRCHEVLCDVPTGSFAKAALPDRALRLAVPANAFVDMLDDGVAASFDTAKRRLSEAGHALVEVDMSQLAARLDAVRVIVASEALEQYRSHLGMLSRIGDPNVLARIRSGEDFTRHDIADAQTAHRLSVGAFIDDLRDYDAMIAPTITMETPLIDEANADFATINPRLLRNTTLINLAYGCAVTLPVARTGLSPAALMVAGPGGRDESVFAAARIIEHSLHG